MKTSLALPLLILGLAISVQSQTCADSHDTFAAEFDSEFYRDSSKLWLYNNIAKGAECVAISRTLTPEEEWSEYALNIPSGKWIKYEDSLLPGEDDLILNINNYSAYMNGGIFPEEVCVHACRIRSWCQSVDFSYGYDRCRLSKSRGVPADASVKNIVSYIEKPVRQDELLKNYTSAVSYFHLALKMLAVGDYERSLSLMQMTLRVDKWNKMNYWGVAVLSILSGRPVSDAKNVTDSIPSGVELPTDMSATEMQYFTSLETALATSGFEINALAVAYKDIYDASSAPKDVLAGVIAAKAFELSNNDDSSKSLVKEMVENDPSNIYTLYLYLQVFTENMEILLEQGKEMVMESIDNLLKADSKNIKAYMIAAKIYKYYQMPENVVELFDKVIRENYISDAVDNEYISENMGADLLMELYISAHTSYLYRFNIRAAEELEQKVDDASGLIFEILSYIMKAKRFFETSTLVMPDQISLEDFTSVVQINTVDDEHYTVARIAQYMYQQAIVTHQLRTSDDEALTNFNLLISNWKKLRDNSTKFNKDYTAVVSYNIFLLNVEKALASIDDSTQEKLFGENGEFEMAAQLDVEYTDYQVLGLPEMMAHAVTVLSRIIPAPLGRLTDGAAIPKDLAALVVLLDDSWPTLTPTKLQMKAAIQLAIGKLDDSRATLAVAQNRSIEATITWIENALAKLDSVSDILDFYQLSLPSFPPPVLLFDSDDQKLRDGLDKDLDWKPDVSAMTPCNVFRYKNVEDDAEAPWAVKSQSSLISAESISYLATNIVSCKQRCLVEKSFDCKAVTFGFNRCLLHSQTYEEVGESQRFDNIDDEQYLALPSCPTATTNSFSQLLLAVKALSNGMYAVALEKLDEAIEKDEFMGMPKILKAIVLLAQCSSRVQEASDLLAEPAFETEYEKTLKLAVQSILVGNLQDARNYFQDLAEDYPNDPVVNSLRRDLVNVNNDDPVLAADYISIINQDVEDADEEIAALRTLSPASARPHLYEAYQLYLSGKWMELIGKINAIEEDDYLDYDSESPLKHLAVQLKHFALVQKGQFIEATKLYEEYKDTEQLSAFMYAAQTYTQLIDSAARPSLGDKGEFEAAGDCDINNNIADVVYWAMSGAVVFTSDSDDTIKLARLSKISTDINELFAPELSLWKFVAQAFYEFGESLDAAENVDASSDKIYLSPSFDQSLVSVTLISAEELLAWARLAQGNTNFEETENLLNTNSSPSNRAVTLWLKYRLYRDWRGVDPSKRNESISAAEEFVELWADSDNTTEGSFYYAIAEYSKYPDPVDDYIVNFNRQGLSTNLPVWAIWTIIGISAGVLVAIVISCIVWLCVRERNGDGEKKRVYSGSIHSTNSFQDNVIPGHGEVMYIGQMSEDPMGDQAEMDFKN